MGIPYDQVSRINYIESPYLLPVLVLLDRAGRDCTGSVLSFRRHCRQPLLVVAFRLLSNKNYNVVEVPCSAKSEAANLDP